MGIHNRRPVLRAQDWPALERAAWTKANLAGDLLAPGGRAAEWAPNMREQVETAYGRLLLFLRETGRLDDASNLRERITEPILREYVALRSARVSPTSVGMELRLISAAVHAMDSDVDRRLINHVSGRFARIKSQRKQGRIVSPRILLELGKTLMAEADATSVSMNRAALLFRNGLLIAMLALCLLRSGNLAQMRRGRHVASTPGGVRLSFTSEEMKSRKPLDVPFPAELLPALDRYLRLYRPHLLGTADSNVMWPNRKGQPMTRDLIGQTMGNVTRRRFGVRVSPHLFRDAAAFIVEMKPQWAMMAAAALHHSNYRVTEKHYIHGQQHRAARLYQTLLRGLAGAAAPATTAK